jgi:hypothetical protein
MKFVGVIMAQRAANWQACMTAVTERPLSDDAELE